jgi:hypothetical protein
LNPFRIALTAFRKTLSFRSLEKRANLPNKQRDHREPNEKAQRVVNRGSDQLSIARRQAKPDSAIQTFDVWV